MPIFLASNSKFSSKSSLLVNSCNTLNVIYLLFAINITKVWYITGILLK